MPRVVVSDKQILKDFALKLRLEGKRDLYDLLFGKTEMEGIKAIADVVGCPDYPKEGERIDDYLNVLQPFVDDYETTTNG